MSTKPKPRPSSKPQRVNKDSWYYEGRSKITFIAWVGEGPRRNVANVEIPWKTLMASAARCRPEQVK